jgi:hypothetical protein
VVSQQGQVTNLHADKQFAVALFFYSCESCVVIITTVIKVIVINNSGWNQETYYKMSYNFAN